MNWSYSRLSSFDDCKYGWYLKYIKHVNSGQPKFFATYGSFVHKVLELYLSGKLTKDQVVDYYIEHYDDAVKGSAPSEKIETGFFERSLQYLQTIDFPFHNIIATEKQVHFEVDGYKFVGFIDVLAQTGKRLHMVDHKSHGLRNRSGRKFQTQYDKELDRYLRQQYLYSIPIKEQYGKYPATLNFNCYRFNRFITQKFNPDSLNNVKYWAVGQINAIREQREWQPNPDPFRCTYICDSSQHCQFCQKFKTRG